MIAAWFRIKYPYLIDGVIAASAPIWSFLGLSPPYNPNAFYRVVTDDASSKGGATDTCKTNFRNALPRIATLGTSPEGLALLSSTLRTCHPLRNEEDVWGVVEWVQAPWATLAMGDFPYASSYLLHGMGMLPPWPVRAACRSLAPASFPDDAALLAAVRDAVGVYYNYSGTVSCFYNGVVDVHAGSEHISSYPYTSFLSSSFPLPRARMAPPRRRPTFPSHASQTRANECVGDWGYQWCTEMVQPFSSGTNDDMFWPPSPFNLEESIAECQELWGVRPRATWASIGLGGSDLRAASNMVLSNGQLDPWHPGGVLHNVSETVVALMITNGAHHLDLMFSDPADPPDVRAVREEEMRHVAKWIQQRAGHIS